jgi:hypothetical protein
VALSHFDRDVFTYQPTGEMSPVVSGVTFTVGAAQNATQIVIENLDIHGDGTFVRSAVDKQK